MAVNWKILNVEDFRIFSASDDIIEETNRRKAQLNAANEQPVLLNEPPKTLIHINSFAPELSAAFNLVNGCIIVRLLI